jgi:uncharacterized protein (DUF169 family)
MGIEYIHNYEYNLCSLARMFTLREVAMNLKEHLTQYRSIAKRMIAILGLQYAPIGKRLLPLPEGLTCGKGLVGFGCYGCRDATDMASGEAILGFSSRQLPGIIKHLEYLAQKAIPPSRSKLAFQVFTDKNNTRSNNKNHQ